MATIVEAALVEEAAELGKTGGEQLRVDAPGPDLPQARRVHHVGAPPTPPTPPTRGEGHELRRPRRVLPRPPLLVDLADPEIQARLERVHETRLPHPGFPGQDGGAAPQQVAQRGETLGRLDRRREHLIAGRAVAAAEQLERSAVELEFVEHQHRGDAIRLGDHEQAVEHAEIRLGIPCRRYHHYLVHVGGDRLPPAGPARAGRAAREQRAARAHTGDGGRAVAANLQLDHIPRDHAVIVFALELPAQHRSHFPALRVHAIRRARPGEHDARHTLPPSRFPAPSPSTQASRCVFTSCSVSASSGASASAGVRP